MALNKFGFWSRAINNRIDGAPFGIGRGRDANEIRHGDWLAGEELEQVTLRNLPGRWPTAAFRFNPLLKGSDWTLDRALLHSCWRRSL